MSARQAENGFVAQQNCFVDETIGGKVTDGLEMRRLQRPVGSMPRANF
jgi:hypothetical protein